MQQQSDISVRAIHKFQATISNDNFLESLNKKPSSVKVSTISINQEKMVKTFLFWLFKIWILPYSHFLKNSTCFCNEFVYLFSSHHGTYFLKLRKTVKSSLLFGCFGPEQLKRLCNEWTVDERAEIFDEL